MGHPARPPAPARGAAVPPQPAGLRDTAALGAQDAEPLLGALLATAWGQGPKLTVCWIDCWGAPAGGGAPQCPAVPWGTRTPARLQRQVAAWTPAAQLPANALPCPDPRVDGQARLQPAGSEEAEPRAGARGPRPRPRQPPRGADPGGQKMRACRGSGHKARRWRRHTPSGAEQRETYSALKGTAAATERAPNGPPQAGSRPEGLVLCGSIETSTRANPRGRTQ